MRDSGSFYEWSEMFWFFYGVGDCQSEDGCSERLYNIHWGFDEYLIDYTVGGFIEGEFLCAPGERDVFA